MDTVRIVVASGSPQKGYQNVYQFVICSLIEIHRLNIVADLFYILIRAVVRIVQLDMGKSL